MIHIFGDSHGMYNYARIKYNVINHSESSITMHRVGRDKLNYINFKNYFINDGDVIIYQFGEIDTRCHIGKQESIGRNFDEITSELIENYINSIKENISYYNNLKIIIGSIPPPMSKVKYENKYGPIDHEFPFVGTDEERVRNTMRMNNLLLTKCKENNFYFLDYYNDYKDENGLLIYEYSDEMVHIIKNEFLLEKLYEIIDKLNM